MSAFNKAWLFLKKGNVVKSRRHKYPVPTSPSDWERGNAQFSPRTIYTRGKPDVHIPADPNDRRSDPQLRFGPPMFGESGGPERAFASSSGREGWDYGEMPNPPVAVQWAEHEGDPDKLKEGLEWRNKLAGRLQRESDPTDPLWYSRGSYG